jgi:hypothetical protein
MLGDAADIVCPAGTQNKAGNLLVSEKKSSIKNVFGNNHCNRCTKDRAGFL